MLSKPNSEIAFRRTPPKPALASGANGGVLAKNRWLARAAQNGVSMFAIVWQIRERLALGRARERSFRGVLPENA